MRRAGLTNVRLLCTDAADCVQRRLAERSLWRMHIYFPDPWPKRRHHRRRLIQPPFVAAARRCLAIGGQLIIVTDHLDYYRQIQAVLAAAEGLAAVPLPQMSDKEGELVGSNFERKYIAQGRPFYAECDCAIHDVWPASHSGQRVRQPSAGGRNHLAAAGMPRGAACSPASGG